MDAADVNIAVVVVIAAEVQPFECSVRSNEAAAAAERNNKRTTTVALRVTFPYSCLH